MSDAPTACDCIEQMNNALSAKGRHCEVSVPHLLIIKGGESFFATGRPEIAMCFTEGKKRGEKLPVICAAFCPFCGRKYLEREGFCE